ncbi:hypothetical protein BOX15_Mlig032719g1 [Macrostomum lignano]|uniref:Uncharacterized protein n=2 Tax=Macrostomum lignano TaxID=282301 RepID=A0A267DR83_9PLAT|nr:hypothetical protein BOX15_Mlig032719g3 [Macrostomum lignano]PAA52378.1 hypothetical protein BOX15_Mlig032719g2 [Macrostomum lignano]PAA79646.1 hypothetical protein BOX15_Mlig032719g4 [Macrostomum lignano]PAA87774.1 hypothetical protein BOX15_Mlig032719g1 [Macrostomum lignano]
MSTIEEMESIFRAMDANGDGVLSEQELTDYLVKKKGFNADFVQTFLANFDSNNDGKVTLNECLEKLGLIPPQEVEYSAWKTVFDSFDKDGSGFIEADELPKVLEEIGSTTKYNRSNFENWIREHDSDADGRVSYSEFLNWVRGPRS